MTALSVGLVQACDDQGLFGFPLWPKQRELLGAVEAGPRTHSWSLGRRSGKTTSGAIAALWCCTLRPELRERLRPRERGYAVAIATNMRQARLFVQAARSIIEPSPLLAALVESETEDEIVFQNGMVLTAFPCTARGGRGWPIACLVMDEAAHHVDTEGNSAAESVWRSLAPSTIQFGDLARVIVASTPAGSSGWFSDFYDRAASGAMANAVAHHATTLEANPSITEEYLSEERIALGEEAYRSEYEATFEGGGGQFFTSEELREVVRERDGVLPEDGRGWICALDPSSGGGDPFACVLVGRDTRPGYEGHLLVGHVEAWKARRGARDKLSRRTRAERDLWLDSVLDRVAEIAKRYRASVLSDQHLPGVVIDELAKRGVHGAKVVPWTSTAKSEAFRSLRARVVTERISLPDHADLLAELRRVRTRFRAGSSAVEVLRAGDSHGDLALATALGVHELDQHGDVAPLPERRSAEPDYQVSAGIWDMTF